MATQSGAWGSGGVAATASATQARIRRTPSSLDTFHARQDSRRTASDSSDSVFVGRVPCAPGGSLVAGNGGVRRLGRTGPVAGSKRESVSTSRGQGNPPAQCQREFEGPLISAAIIGEPGGRWSELTVAAVPSSPQLAHALVQDVQEVFRGKPHLFGFCILRSWRPLSSPGCTTRASLRAVLARQHQVRCVFFPRA